MSLMREASPLRISLVGVFLFASSCAKPPPAAPPPTPNVEPAPPSPPPKCETLAEKCSAKRTDRVAIEGTLWTITPPPGWTFGRSAKEPIAITKAAALAVEGRNVPDAKKSPRDEMAAAVLGKLAIAMPRAKGKLTFPKKPDKTVSVAKQTVALYQFDGAVREGKHGPLLVFVTPVADGAMVVGAGFVAEDDETNADAAILEAIESLSTAADTGAP